MPIARSGSGWYLAKSLGVLYDQIDKAFPGRDDSSDGTIGNRAHQATNSDHNPHGGVVYALDITHDPAHGVDTYALAEQLRAGEDERIEYIISDRKIASGTGQSHTAWEWRPYNGENPHDMHIHVNVKDVPLGDKTEAWELGAIPLPVPTTGKPSLAKGSRGEEVKVVQQLLMVDGIFGPSTEKAVKQFQKDNGLSIDGIVGPYTWRALLKAVPVLVELEGKWIENVTATVFGGSSELERSAYDSHPITENEMAVALPDRFEGKRPVIEVKSDKGAFQATIEDVGPWNVNDPYWETLGQRPDAETHKIAGTPLTLDGPNKGRIPANAAGIDLSPALARKLGVDGKGLVSWRFVV
jgi:peptidoglycan hydrolase-like protein with peptidoglycan-binding domain